MKNIWILIANKTGGEIFCRNSSNKTRLIKTFDNPKGSLKEGELNSDRSGRFGYQDLNRENSSVDHLVDKFAKKISLYLEHGRVDNRFEELIVVAGPSFNGILKSKFNKNLRQIIIKNLVKEVLVSVKEEKEFIRKIIADNKHPGD